MMQGVMIPEAGAVRGTVTTWLSFCAKDTGLEIEVTGKATEEEVVVDYTCMDRLLVGLTRKVEKGTVFNQLYDGGIDKKGNKVMLFIKKDERETVFRFQTEGKEPVEVRISENGTTVAYDYVARVIKRMELE